MEAFSIAEKYVPKTTLMKVARAVLKAQDIKEDSWVNDDISAPSNYLGHYEKDDYQSAKEAVKICKIYDKRFWAYVIYRWNFSMWNGVQTWAEAIIKEYGGK